MKNNTGEELSVVIPEKPKQVRIAINILYIQMVLVWIGGVLTRYYNYRFSGSFFSGSFLSLVIIIIVYLLLIRKISDGKVWARNLLLVYFILSTFSFVWLSFVDRLISLPIPLTLYMIFVGIIGLIATIMLYIGPSKDWFEFHRLKKETSEDVA